jgi:hypothetical protein
LNPSQRSYEAVDAADKVSSRLNFAALIYAAGGFGSLRNYRVAYSFHPIVKRIFPAECQPLARKSALPSCRFGSFAGFVSSTAHTPPGEIRLAQPSLAPATN